MNWKQQDKPTNSGLKSRSLNESSVDSTILYNVYEEGGLTNCLGINEL